MVVRQVMDADTADRVFGALADPTRRDIVTRVLDRPASVSALAGRYAMSFAAVQRHVAVLERAGLVTKEAHGRERLVRGDVTRLRAAARLLDRYEDIWRGRVERMEDVLAEVVPTHRTHVPTHREDPR
jgi:DNA-binding transcriptional ArsR family regulator